jgi:mannose-6-phosphate isomerase class I
MDYTQDESYYIMDADEEAYVYLGFKENIDPKQCIRALKDAQKNSDDFNADAFVEKWPAKKHDHFLIPAGTIHCSGEGCMVLEISATPYIFTFKLWDWGRLGLDGKPRPINIEHGEKVLDWSRTSGWTKQHLVNQVEYVDQGIGWSEEKTGLHNLQFIETRRHWFTESVTHQTNGTVHVLAVVEGEEVIVESPSSAFEPFITHYGEVFIIPAAIDTYTITPSSKTSKKHGTLQAFVRSN